MRHITTLVWHYSATYDDQDIGAAEINEMHLARGWSGIGYNGVIRLDGTEEPGRPYWRIPAQVAGYNERSLGFVTIGGLRRGDGPDVGQDTRTREQIATQIAITERILARFPSIRLVTGHRNLAATQCPGYDVPSWWAEVKGKRMPASHIAPDAPAASWPMLRHGNQGDGVRMLQEALDGLGIEAGPVDGVFGPKTERAVRDFQRAAGIDVDGIAGPMTWAELGRVGRS